MAQTTTAEGRPGPGLARRLPWIVALAALVVYLPSLAAGFVYDDNQLIVNNPQAHDLGHLGTCFVSYFWDVPDTTHAESLHYYRPLVCASYALNWVTSDGAAWSFHLTNVVAHAAATFLAARVALRWAPHPALATLAALVFALHPSRTENVIWVSGRTDVFMALFGLLAVELAHVSARGAAPRRLPAAMGSIVGVAAATLCKEPGVLFGVLCAYETTAGADLGRLGRSAAIATWGTLSVAASYLIARIWFPVGGFPVRFTPLHGLFAVGAYVERLVVPWPQTVCYRPLWSLDGVTQFPLLPVALGGLTVLGALAIAVRAARLGLRALVLAATPLMFMAPLLDFVPTGLSYSTADRFLYVPAYLAVLGISTVFPEASIRIAARRPIRLLGVGIAAIWSVIDVLRVGDYTSESAYWRHELTLAPYNPHVMQEVARLDARAGDVDAAAKLLRRFLSDPRRYILIENPASRASAYARLVGLVAAKTPDGDVAALEELLGELRAYLDVRPDALRGTAGGAHLRPRPTQAILEEALERNRVTLLAEAGFLASRVSTAEATQQLLDGLSERDLGAVWNPANLVLAHARAFDFARAREVLEQVERALGATVATDLRQRIDTAERWIETGRGPARGPVGRALALAELGAYVRALRELRPSFERQKEPNELSELYVQLLVSARLVTEARREARASFGEKPGNAFVDATEAALSPRLRALPEVESDTWWMAPAP